MHSIWVQNYCLGQRIIFWTLCIGKYLSRAERKDNEDSVYSKLGREKDVINGALAIAREVFRWRNIQFEISAWVWILWLMLWSFQLSYLMKTKPWSRRWLFCAAVFSCNHASNQIQEDSIFWTCTFDVLTSCWISYTIASWSRLSSESSCFRDSTQELALTRWITNNFNHEKTSTFPPSWGGGTCFGIVSTIPKCIALWKRDTMSRRP